MTKPSKSSELDLRKTYFVHLDPIWVRHCERTHFECGAIPGPIRNHTKSYEIIPSGVQPRKSEFPNPLAFCHVFCGLPKWRNGFPSARLVKDTIQRGFELFQVQHPRGVSEFERRSLVSGFVFPKSS